MSHEELTTHRVSLTLSSRSSRAAPREAKRSRTRIEFSPRRVHAPRRGTGRLAINGELFLPLDRLVQCEAAVGTLDVARRVPGNSDAGTTPRARLRLAANPQRATASRTPYAAERQQHHDDGDWERGVERPSWNPCHPLQDVRRNQARKEQGSNCAPDNSVSLIEVFAHRFHGARFYSPWSAAQCSSDHGASSARRSLLGNVRQSLPALAGWTPSRKLAAARGASRVVRGLSSSGGRHSLNDTKGSRGDRVYRSVLHHQRCKALLGFCV